MDATSDTTSDRTSSTNDSTRNMTSPRSRTRTYDAEGSVLKYWIDRLQGLCAGPTDIEAIREATKTLGRTTQLFFESRQRYLDSLPEEERDPAIMEFDELIDKLQTTQLQADELLATAETSSSAEITQPPAIKNNNRKTNSTRPIPKLPTFDGEILQFKAFWDQFSAAVHRREDLEDVTKFVHLRSCLAGAALHAISGVTTAVENYPAVVQLLHDRFYRVSDILDAHILKIFSVTKEVVKGKEGLLALHDKLYGPLLELKAIGRDLDTAVSGFRMALPQLVSQLPKNIQSRWKGQCGKSAEEPTSQTFLDFLAEQARCAVDLRKRSRPPRQTIGAFHTSLHPTCPVCQGEHRVTVCPQFLNQQWSTVYPPRCTGTRCPSEQGLCLHIYMHDDQSGTSRAPQRADNGDNNWEQLQRKLNEERIRWKFITPRAPWCGGYWERLIRSIKNALRKTIRGALLKYDELHTVLCEIEARINDRPLVFMGDDIAGEAALTPAHFLIGRELPRLPCASIGVYRRDDTPSEVNHLIKRWRHRQRLTTQLWKRWKQEYITTLATRGRWHKTGQEPRVGDIVLVHEPSTTWIKWPIE
ncbi:hypothetical protein T09_10010 [Trichinella sp. T9]|nr:hypothetical protein T09_10010 [Trichinella sp. T9]